MADDPTMVIEAENFLRFAKAKGMSLDCPVCNTSGMNLVTTEADRGVSFMDLSLSKPEISDIRPYFQMSLECKNCGHVRLFRRSTISDWLRANPA